MVHRAHFHQAMHALAIDLDVTVKLASRVISYNVETPSITFVDASTVSVDLAVAANGISFLLDARFRARLICLGVNSTARAVVLGGADIPPGVQDFPRIELWWNWNVCSRIRTWRGCSRNLHLTYGGYGEFIFIALLIKWMSRLGNNRHVMTCVISAGKSFNMVLSHPDVPDSAEWTQYQGEILVSMQKEFDGWGPVYVVRDATEFITDVPGYRSSE